MQRKTVFRVLWIGSILLLAGLSCQFIEDVTGVSTIQAVATEIDIEGIVTQANVGGIATEMNIESITTQMEPMLTDIATDVEPILTDIATQFFGEKPADIPVIEGGSMDPITVAGLVVYTVDKDFQSVVNFYEQEMPKNGWIKDVSKSSTKSDSAKLYFTKGNRKAEVEIEDFFGMVTVTIKIEGE
jgi:hypothetical protein